MRLSETASTQRKPKQRVGAGMMLEAGVLSADPAPVVKWAGGKRQLLPHLIRYLPASFNVYHEPFVGGGALFFELCRLERLNGYAILSDANDRLVTMYTVLRDQPGSLIAELERLSGDIVRAAYDDARHEFNRKPPSSEVRTGALFLYLNRLCFNGLFRVNRKGEFNVPYGRYVNPDVVRAATLMASCGALACARVFCQDFEAALALAGQDDLVYLDPPYSPVSTTSFTAYHGAFGFDEQIRLSNACRALDARGGRFMLSNSSHDELLRLYEGFDVQRVRARRAINSSAAGRGEVDEIIVRNYRTG